MASWLSDASANRHIKTYVKDFLDVSGNLSVRSNEDYAWNAYGQVLSGNYESDGVVYYGLSTDMDASGTTIIVGATADNTRATDDGAVYVYRYDTTAEIWYQLGNTITESTGANTGRLVQISDNGNRIAYADDLGDEVYIYDYNSNTNTWDSAGYIPITPDVTSSGGFELSGDGNTFLVGDNVDGTYGSNTGTVVVYRNTSGTTWTRIGQLSSDNLGLVESQTWGLAISYNGNRIILGAPYYDDADGNTNSGLFWVLDYTGDGTASTDNSDWSQVGSTIYGSPAERLGVGGEMSSDGSIIVVGSIDVTPSSYVYQYDATVSGSWKLLGTPIRVLNSTNGACLSNDGTILLVNETANDTAGTDNGALFIYKYIDNDWVQQGSTIYGSYTGSILGQFNDTGLAMNADGSKVVAGGYLADVNGTNSGYVQAFQWSKKAPYSNPALDISGGVVTMWSGAEENPNNWDVTNVTTFSDGTDNYGSNMKFNADGTIMVVGERGYNSNAGRIHAYKYRNGIWSKMGSDVADSNITYVGGSLAINDSGLIIGAGSGEDSGGVIVWEFINGDWSVKGGEISNNNINKFATRGISFNGEGNIVACKGDDGGAAVYQYNSGTTSWDQLGSDFTGVVTNYGRNEIALNQAGNIVAIGDPGYDSPSTDAGRVGIFQYNSGTSSWDQLGDWITAPSTTSGGNGDHYGVTVSLSSDGYILAFGTMIGTGATVDYHARIFQYVPSVDQWTPRSPDIQNENAISAGSTDTKFGNNVALSGDGNTLVVNDQDAQTTSGIYSGAVHVFKYINGVYKWITRLDGPTDVNSYLGADGVSISRDGTRFGGSREGSNLVMIGDIVNSPALKIDDGSTIMGGNVGIGKDNPAYPLDIFENTGDTENSIRYSATAISNTTSKSYMRLERGNYGGAIGGYLEQGVGAGMVLGTISNGTITDQMTIKSNGNVGIGTDNPDTLLRVLGETRSTVSSAQDSASEAFDSGWLAGQSYTTHGQHYLALTRDISVHYGGNTNINPYSKPTVMTTLTFLSTSYDRRGATGDKKAIWKIGHYDTHRARFTFVAVQDYYSNLVYTNKQVGYINGDGDVGSIDFTGQHRSFVEGLSAKNNDGEKYKGLIVCANKDSYTLISDAAIKGKDAITINESLPDLSLCKKDKDKSVYGVISSGEDLENGGYREYALGNFVSTNPQQQGDFRFHINALGEGAIWVCNEHGNLESGDYITSSSIPGYGVLQDDDILHNYTVAKITMSCDFQPIIQYKKQIIKQNIEFTIDASNNCYDMSGNVIYKPSDSGTGEKTYKLNKYEYKYDTNSRVISVTENVLDANEEIQWEDTEEQEYAYNIRHVDPSGNILTEEEYNTKKAAGEEAYIAAFVGCTYHCG